MRITTYKTHLDENKHNVLVKEKAFNYDCGKLSNSEEMALMFENCFHMSALAEEYLYMIALDCKCKPLGVFEISHGTVTEAHITPREVFIRLFLVGAVGFVLCHNHPSGDCSPSKDDVTLTKRFLECSKILGVSLADHIIIGNRNYISLRNYMEF